MQFVPDKLTPLSVDALLEALRDGYTLAMGQAPRNAKRLACLAAQLCLESGNGQKAHCWNFGNKKIPSGWEGLYTTFRCDEIFDGATAKRATQVGQATIHPWKTEPGKPERFRVVLEAGHPWARFKAYESAARALEDYVAFLCAKEAVWLAARDGDPARFSHELRLAQYYTADEATYTASVVSIFKRVMPACERLVAGGAPDLSDEDRAAIATLVTLTLYGGALGWATDREPEAVS